MRTVMVRLGRPFSGFRKGQLGMASRRIGSLAPSKCGGASNLADM